MNTCVCYETCMDDLLDDFRSDYPTEWVDNLDLTNQFKFERKLIDIIAYQNEINK